MKPIIQYPLKKGQFIEIAAPKKSIVFHHTAGSGTPQQVIDMWNNDTQGPIGTHYVIGRDGVVVQCMDEKHWAYALGVKNPLYQTIEAQSIQIELIAYGFLHKNAEGKYLTDYGNAIPEAEVCVLPISFKNIKYFHAYTDAQIEALKELIPAICERHGIKGSLSNLDFNLSSAALKGAPGFWTHNSFRADKTDIYPDPRILEAFKKGWHEKYSS